MKQCKYIYIYLFVFIVDVIIMFQLTVMDISTSRPSDSRASIECPILAVSPLSSPAVDLTGDELIEVIDLTGPIIKPILINLRDAVVSPAPVASTSGNINVLPAPIASTSRNINVLPAPIASISRNINVLPAPIASTSRNINVLPAPIASTSRNINVLPAPIASTSRNINVLPAPIASTSRNINVLPAPIASTSRNINVLPAPIASISRNINVLPAPIASTSRNINVLPAPIASTSRNINVLPAPIASTSRNINVLPAPIASTSRNINVLPAPIASTSRNINVLPAPIASTSRNIYVLPAPIASTSRNINVLPAPIASTSRNINISPCSVPAASLIIIDLRTVPITPPDTIELSRSNTGVSQNIVDAQVSYRPMFSSCPINAPIIIDTSGALISPDTNAAASQNTVVSRGPVASTSQNIVVSPTDNSGPVSCAGVPIEIDPRYIVESSGPVTFASTISDPSGDSPIVTPRSTTAPKPPAPPPSGCNPDGGALSPITRLHTRPVHNFYIDHDHTPNFFMRQFEETSVDQHQVTKRIISIFSSFLFIILYAKIDVDVFF